MAKLVYGKNGKIEILTFEEIIPVFENGRRGDPVQFDGALHLTAGRTSKTLEVILPKRVVVLAQWKWSPLLRDALCLLVGLLLHRWYVLTSY